MIEKEPSVPVSALRQLVENFRQSAERDVYDPYTFDDPEACSAAECAREYAIDGCADELEWLIKDWVK